MENRNVFCPYPIAPEDSETFEVCQYPEWLCADQRYPNIVSPVLSELRREMGKSSAPSGGSEIEYCRDGTEHRYATNTYMGHPQGGLAKKWDTCAPLLEVFNTTRYTYAGSIRNGDNDWTPDVLCADRVAVEEGIKAGSVARTACRAITGNFIEEPDSNPAKLHQDFNENQVLYAFFMPDPAYLREHALDNKPFMDSIYPAKMAPMNLSKEGYNFEELTRGQSYLRELKALYGTDARVRGSDLASLLLSASNVTRDAVSGEIPPDSCCIDKIREDHRDLHTKTWVKDAYHIDGMNFSYCLM